MAMLQVKPAGQCMHMWVSVGCIQCSRGASVIAYSCSRYRLLRALCSSQGIDTINSVCLAGVLMLMAAGIRP